MLARYESIAGKGSSKDRELRESVFFLANAFPKYTRNLTDDRRDAPSENRFYTKFVKKHQRGLEHKFEGHYRTIAQDETLNDTERQEKAQSVAKFKSGLLKYLGERSPYRAKDPSAFVVRKTLEANGDLNVSDRNKLLERYLTPVKGLKPSPRVENELYARKLKEANYGKWFLAPGAYNRKIAALNRKIRTTIDHSLA